MRRLMAGLSRRRRRDDVRPPDAAEIFPLIDRIIEWCQTAAGSPGAAGIPDVIPALRDFRYAEHRHQHPDRADRGVADRPGRRLQRRPRPV